jgi:hypothetical protein
VRRRTWLLPVFIGIAGITGIAGCGGQQPITASTTPPTTSTSGTPTATVTPTPSITGNGVAQLAPAEVLARAKQATTAVTSVRMRGRFRDEGQLVGMDFRTQGSTAAGYIELDGSRIDLKLIGTAIYFKPDRQFFEDEGGEEVADALAGKWLKAKIDDKEVAEFVSITSMSTMLDCLPDPGEAVYARKGAPTTINGTPALTVTDGVGDPLFVATEGKPYLLRAAWEDGKEYIDFLEHGEPLTVEPPDGKLVVDLGKMPS